MKKGANVRIVTIIFTLFQKREWVTPFSRQEHLTSMVSSTDPRVQIILREEDPPRFLSIVSLAKVLLINCVVAQETIHGSEEIYEEEIFDSVERKL